jgi:hypothetical protein
MKNYIKYSIIFLVPLVLLSSKCKDKEPVIRTLKGRLMNNCTEPYANGLIKLRNNTGGGASFSEDINGNKDFYTDENGYFEINYKSRGTLGTLYAPYKAIERIPISNEELVFDIGEVNLNGTVNFVIKLEVNNPYTELDTLTIADYNSNQPNPQLKFVGPFVNQILDTVYNRPYISYPIKYSKIPQTFIAYGFTQEVNVQYQYFDTPFCDNGYAEAIITLD